MAGLAVSNNDDLASTIRLDGEPPHAVGADPARVAEVSGALYEVTSHLRSRLYADLATVRPGPIAEASWDALISISTVWREDPERLRWATAGQSLCPSRHR